MLLLNQMRRPVCRFPPARHGFGNRDVCPPGTGCYAASHALHANGSGPMARERTAADDELLSTLFGCLETAPATASQLSALTGRSASTISARLAGEDGRRIRCVRRGRARYFVLGLRGAEPREGEEQWAGWPSRLPSTAKPIARCRHCNDHLAGRAGVAVFHGLVRRGALLDPGRPKPKGSGAKTPVVPGPAAAELFAAVGVDLDTVARCSGRFAFACLDWTERRAHLGGALGRALYDRFVDLRWIVPDSTSRVVRLTDEGRRGLSSWLKLPLAFD
jgi:hypothetical protein